MTPYNSARRAKFISPACQRWVTWQDELSPKELALSERKRAEGGATVAGRKTAKKLALIFLLLVLIVLGIFFVVPSAVESSMNRVLHAPPYAASGRARALHTTLDAADLHADSLLWGRDLTQRSTRGHVDLPRLVEGGVALQVFTLPTKTPWGLNIERNNDRSDQIFWLAVAQHWPLATWFSLTERSLYQASRLDSFAQRSSGHFNVIHTSADLAAYLDRRAKDQTLTAGILGLEGSRALDGSLENLAKVYAAG